jgi:hypothetical protein
MEPTLHDDSTIVIRRVRRPPRLGEIVVFRNGSPDVSDPAFLVKRVTALERHGSDVLCYVSGDNVAEALTSATLGLIRIDLIIGVMFFRFSSRT